MKTVAIIAEYNPFHLGHKYQIDKIREQFGADTAIIAVMSGNFTERGELAFIDKWERARSAVECGVNLVIELPFPYSMSSAEFFARAAVHIIDSLGCVDIISFGSECGDIDTLMSAAKNMRRKEYQEELERLLNDAASNTLGYAKLSEIAYRTLYEEDPPLSASNNILALEYIKAAVEFNSSLEFHTIKRIGADYNEEKIKDTSFQSATALRSLISDDIDSAKSHLPKPSFDIIKEQITLDAAPISEKNIELAVLSKFRLNSPKAKCDIHDAEGGLYNRLIKFSHKATNLVALKKLAATKKYTDARIRRAIWFSYLGVTSSDVRVLPEYTQILAMDKVGQAVLKKIRKTSGISIITKPSGAVKTDVAKKQKLLSDKADSFFQLAKPMPMPSSDIYKRSPFVKVD